MTVTCLWKVSSFTPYFSHERRHSFAKCVLFPLISLTAEIRRPDPFPRAPSTGGADYGLLAGAALTADGDRIWRAQTTKLFKHGLD
jgi:hypothetical protein